MKLMQEAKRRLLVNIGTNLLVLFVTSLVGIWLVPYLIRHLGVELYGMVPLALSISHYSGLFTIAITGTVGRFVALYVNKEEFEEANSYFSTAFFSLMSLCLLLVVPAVLIAIWLPRLFQIPAGYEHQAGVLFFLVISSSFISALSSPFMVSTFVKHRFDLSNFARILSKILQVMVLVLCFRLLSTSLFYVGLSYVGMSLLLFVSGVLFTRRLTPELHLRIGLFNSKALREMAGMGMWLTIGQVGVLLYLSIDLVVINIFLGPLQGGRYATITQWVVLLALLGGSISSVFSPIAIEYIAKNNIKGLAHQIQRSTKFMGMAMALPIGLLCGLSQPLLTRWLGESFADLSPLMWLLVGPMVINISVAPMFAIIRGMNKVKIPAIIGIVGGVVNLVLSIILVRYTGLGLYAVAVATVICLTGKNLLATPMYSAYIMGQRKTIFLKSIVPGVVLGGATGLSCLALSKLFDLATFGRLICAGVVMGLFYVWFCYNIVITKDDRIFIKSLIFRHKESLTINIV